MRGGRELDTEFDKSWWSVSLGGVVAQRSSDCGAFLGFVTPLNVESGVETPTISRFCVNFTTSHKLSGNTRLNLWVLAASYLFERGAHNPVSGLKKRYVQSVRLTSEFYVIMELLDRLKVRRMMSTLRTPQRLLFPLLDLIFSWSGVFSYVSTDHYTKVCTSLRDYVPRFLLSTS